MTYHVVIFYNLSSKNSDKSPVKSVPDYYTTENLVVKIF